MGVDPSSRCHQDWQGSSALLVHPDLAPAAALCRRDENRSAPVVEIVLGERERFLDAPAGAPEVPLL
jgi:hypothetical protein